MIEIINIWLINILYLWFYDSSLILKFILYILCCVKVKPKLQIIISLKIYNNNNNILVPLGVTRLSTFFILLVGFLSFVGFVVLINKAWSIWFPLWNFFRERSDLFLTFWVTISYLKFATWEMSTLHPSAALKILVCHLIRLNFTSSSSFIAKWLFFKYIDFIGYINIYYMWVFLLKKI